MPDYQPKGLDQMIRPKCRVVYFPLKETDYLCSIPGKDRIILNSEIPIKQIPEEAEANSNEKVNQLFWLSDQSDQNLAPHFDLKGFYFVDLRNKIECWKFARLLKV